MRLTRLFLFAGVSASALFACSTYAEDPIPVAVPVRQFQLRAQPIQVQADAVPGANSPNQDDVDKKALDAVGLKKNDSAALLKYLKERTLTDVDRTKIDAIIQRFASENYEDRIKAVQDIERIGQSAVLPLRQAAKNDANHPEILFRSKECLKRIEKVPHSEVAIAVIRALAGVKDPEIIPALLGFLPLADSYEVNATIQATLIANAEVDGKPAPALFTALKDANPARRTAAAVALIEGGKFTPEFRAKEITPKIMEVLEGEKDTNFRFTVVRSLVLGGRDKKSVEMLIDLLPDINRSQIWQAEDFLFQLAGKDSPKERCLKTQDSKVKAQSAWREWWKKNQDTAKFEPGSIVSRIQGRFHLVTLDYRFGQNGMITEFGPDEKERWKLSGLGMPMDVIFTPNNRILVADQNQNAIIERDMNGKVLSTKRFEFDNPAGGGKIGAQPKGLQLLEDGGMLITGPNAVVLYDKDGKEKMKYVRPQVVNFGNMDIAAASRMKSGEIVVSVMNNGPNGQNPQLIFLDEKGKEIKEKTIKTGQPNNYMGSIIEVDKDKILLTEMNQLVEYDLKTGKAGWKKAMNQPRSIQRLPNGNILFVDFNQYPPRVVEQTPDGQEAWSFNMKDQNIQLMKAMIR